MANINIANPADLHQFDNLELLAKKVVEGFIIGLHKSPFHGFSVEFAEHRIYNPGDPIKNIDWKVLARTDKTFIKRFEEETNLRCQIIIDNSSSMYYPKNDDSTNKKSINKLHFSAVSAASIMYMLKKQRDAVGLSMFNTDLHIHTKAKSTTAHQKLLVSHLHNAIENEVENVSTSATKSLHQIAESIGKRALVIIFSDMFENAESNEELFSALQHFKYNKHEVILFHVVDHQKELEFEFSNRPYIFVDMESGEKVKLQPGQVKEEYQKQMKSFLHDLKTKCTQYQIDFIEADINKNFRQVLLPYLVKRQKMM